MPGLFLEITGTQCSGKTSVAKAVAAMYSARYVAVEAEECWTEWSRGRQHCFLAVMGSKWLEALSMAVKGGKIVVDHSLVGVAGYSDFFGDTLTSRYASSAWRAGAEILRETGTRHLLVVLTASPRVLEERCSSRRRPVSDWEAETAAKIQEAILARVAETVQRGYMVVDTSSSSIIDTVRAVISRIGF